MAKKKRAAAQRIVKPTMQPVELTIKVPEDGVVIRVRNGKGALGTIVLINGGIQLMPAHGKKRPDGTIRWDQAEGIMAIAGH